MLYYLPLFMFPYDMPLITRLKSGEYAWVCCAISFAIKSASGGVLPLNHPLLNSRRNLWGTGRSPTFSVERSRTAMPSEPRVGIVFLVHGQVLMDSTSLSAVEIHAGCQDHGGSHDQFWQELLAKRVVPLGSEYDQYP